MRYSRAIILLKPFAMYVLLSDCWILLLKHLSNIKRFSLLYLEKFEWKVSLSSNKKFPPMWVFPAKRFIKDQKNDLTEILDKSNYKWAFFWDKLQDKLEGISSFFSYSWSFYANEKHLVKGQFPWINKIFLRDFLR